MNRLFFLTITLLYLSVSTSIRKKSLYQELNFGTNDYYTLIACDEYDRESNLQQGIIRLGGIVDSIFALTSDEISDKINECFKNNPGFIRYENNKVTNLSAKELRDRVETQFENKITLIIQNLKFDDEIDYISIITAVNECVKLIGDNELLKDGLEQLKLSTNVEGLSLREQSLLRIDYLGVCLLVKPFPIPELLF